MHLRVNATWSVRARRATCVEGPTACQSTDWSWARSQRAVVSLNHPSPQWTLLSVYPCNPLRVNGYVVSCGGTGRWVWRDVQRPQGRVLLLPLHGFFDSQDHSHQCAIFGSISIAQGRGSKLVYIQSYDNNIVIVISLFTCLLKQIADCWAILFFNVCMHALTHPTLISVPAAYFKIVNEKEDVLPSALQTVIVRLPGEQCSLPFSPQNVCRILKNRRDMSKNSHLFPPFFSTYHVPFPNLYLQRNDKGRNSL